ncbi:MarR family transcriptional regulator [Actinomadura violacea]|uniref:MarR family transcriptional regulator n=1 Tax=Actinomadura violacea TaxID=2819934 RepID=A0ABS3RU88_9ACTN|nr:helix-turn-helix domain-containing protein [Actinomadura violacea]MBO2460327.1 MarR family transcriptional regulator [Actinomadura violacea]
MATKNAAANVIDGNGVNGTQGPADGAAGVAGGTRPAGAAGDVWDALAGNPGATVAAIAAAAGVSRATVTRTLTALEADGRAVRTPGGRDGGKRQPDTWHPADTIATDGATTGATDDAVTDGADAGEGDTAPTGPTPHQDAVSGPVDAPGTATGGAGASGADSTTGGSGADADGAGDTGTADADTGTADEDTGADGETGMDPAAVAEARDALTALRDGITAALTALEAGDGEGALTAAEGAYSGSGLVRRLVRAAARGPVRTASGRLRTAPGVMRAKVAGHLEAHPGAAFTPHEVAKVIGHSAGAVSNALDRLAEAGDAELVCERPRRFTTTHRATGAAKAAAPAAR